MSHCSVILSVYLCPTRPLVSAENTCNVSPVLTSWWCHQNPIKNSTVWREKGVSGHVPLLLIMQHFLNLHHFGLFQVLMHLALLEKDLWYLLFHGVSHCSAFANHCLHPQCFLWGLCHPEGSHLCTYWVLSGNSSEVDVDVGIPLLISPELMIHRFPLVLQLHNFLLEPNHPKTLYCTLLCHIWVDLLRWCVCHFCRTTKHDTSCRDCQRWS